MVDIQEFIVKVEEEFEDMPKGALKPKSSIRDHFTWDSINALIFIAHVNVNYDVEITAQDLVDSTTIQSLYDVIKAKKEAVKA
jgi:acyl carrier protein